MRSKRTRRQKPSFQRERNAVLFISESETRNLRSPSGNSELYAPSGKLGMMRTEWEARRAHATRSKERGGRDRNGRGRAVAQCPRANGGWRETRGAFIKAPERRLNTASRSEAPLFTPKSPFTHTVEAGLKVPSSQTHTHTRPPSRSRWRGVGGGGSVPLSVAGGGREKWRGPNARTPEGVEPGPAVTRVFKKTPLHTRNPLTHTHTSSPRRRRWGGGIQRTSAATRGAPHTGGGRGNAAPWSREHV